MFFPLYYFFQTHSSSLFPTLHLFYSFQLSFSLFLTLSMSLSIPATFVSHKRSQRKIYPRYALLRLPCVKDRQSATKYINNAVHYTRNGRENVGVITRVHGNSGVVMGRFKRNLPPQDVGKTVEVKLWKMMVDEL